MTDGVTSPRTVAVVLNYRTADNTIRSVRALRASGLPPSAVIVVDNASGDDSAVRIADAHPGVGLIQQPVNRGFSGGCNAGIREALRLGAGRVLLLNADASVQPSALAAMERLLEIDPALGIVGPIVVSSTETAHVESFGISFSRTTGRLWNQEFKRSLSAVERPERRDVDAVSGCAMLIARAVFERIGLFDEEYFFGFEDVDFCFRAREGEFHVAVAGHAVVAHEGHASIGRRSAQRI
jgi:GT2 family glycosyltransferase